MSTYIPSSNSDSFVWKPGVLEDLSCPTPVGKATLENALSTQSVPPLSVETNTNTKKNQSQSPDTDDSDADQQLRSVGTDPSRPQPQLDLVSHLPVLRVASGGTVCVDVSNIGGPSCCVTVSLDSIIIETNKLSITNCTSTSTRSQSAAELRQLQRRSARLCRGQSWIAWPEHQESCFVSC